MNNLRIIMSTMRLQMKQSFVRPMFRFCLLVNPILNTILLYEMYKNSGEESFMAYVILGAGLMGIWSCKGRRAAFNAEEFIGLQVLYPLVTLIFYSIIASYSFKTTNLTAWVTGNSFLLCTNACIFGLGNLFIGERYYGRLRSIIASPCSKFSLILANGLFPALIAMISSVVGLIVGALIFHVDFTGVSIPLTFLTIICAMISASCFGLFLSVFGLISDSMHLILNVVSYLLMIFTGAEFPIEQLPTFGRVIAEIMPLTKAMKAMKLLFTPNHSDFTGLILLELLTGMVYLLVARAIFDIVQRRACRDGKFDLF